VLENCFYLEGTARFALPGEEIDDPTTLEEMSGETALGVMELDLDVWEARETMADQEEHREVETLGETGPGVKVEPAGETILLPPGPIISGNRDEWTGPGVVAAQSSESVEQPAMQDSESAEQPTAPISEPMAGPETVLEQTGAEGMEPESAATSLPMDSEEEQGIVVYRYYFPQQKVFRQRGQEQPYTLGFFGGGGLRVDSIRRTASVFSSEGFRWLFSTPDYLDYRITLEDDLDMTGMVTSIGTSDQPFIGSLEGNGYKISGLKVPLFGVLGDGARVSNLLLDSADIREAVTYEAFEGDEAGTIRTEVREGERGTLTAGCGILAAYAQNALIYNCAAMGNINLTRGERQAAQLQAGGLIGRITAGTSVSNSFAFVTMAVEPGDGIPTYAGGLIGIVGRDAGAINCYATGLVQTTGTAGGFAAENYGEIDHCYVSDTISDKAEKSGAFVAYMPEQRPEDIIDMEALRAEWKEQKEQEAAEKEERKSGKKAKAGTQKLETVPEAVQSSTSAPENEPGEGQDQDGALSETSPELKPGVQPESGGEMIQEEQPEKPSENRPGNPAESQPGNPAENQPGSQVENAEERQPETGSDDQPESMAENRPGIKTAAGQISRDRSVMVLAATGISQIVGRNFVFSGPDETTVPPAPSNTEEMSSISNPGETTAPSDSNSPEDPGDPKDTKDPEAEASDGEGRKTSAPAWIAQNRSINDCFYDKQMSGVEDEYAMGLTTVEMTGTDVELPGVWHLTQGAYPQLHTMLSADVSDDFGIYSRASVIALFLPNGMSLEEAVLHAYVEEKTPLELPIVSNIDGEQVEWDVNGKVIKKRTP